MKKIIQIFRFEKWNSHHKIFSKINTIQNHHHQIVSSIEWREKNRTQFVFNRRKKKIKKFDRSNFIHFYRSKWFWNYRIIECFKHWIISRAIDQTRSWKIKKILNSNQFRHLIKHLFFDEWFWFHVWWFFRWRTRLFKSFSDRDFISIRRFKTEKNRRIIKKKNFQIRQHQRNFSKHKNFQRTFRKWNQKWKHKIFFRKITINNTNIQRFQ